MCTVKVVGCALREHAHYAHGHGTPVTVCALVVRMRRNAHYRPQLSPANLRQ